MKKITYTTFTDLIHKYASEYKYGDYDKALKIYDKICKISLQLDYSNVALDK